jgi:predicted dehydrogenase
MIKHLNSHLPGKGLKMTTTENASSKTKLRHVVVGVGAGIFKLHRLGLQQENVDLVAVADINPDLGQPRADELDCAFYTDHRAMLAETQPDVAIVITPHPFHAPIAIDCFAAGCHVLVEKPMAVQVAEADAMIEAAQKAGRLLAVNFQQRHRPDVQAARELIQAGKLGQIQYIGMAVTSLRTNAYYQAATWRGTWTGEGGGVLMNQAPHDLDMLCYLLGLPERVLAWTPTQLHHIETEDTALAMLAWPDGAIGSLHVTTAEAGLPQRLEILGTSGCLRLERGQFSFARFETDLRDHIAHSTEQYRAPRLQPETVELGEGRGDHLAIYRNFHAAILEGAPVAADGASARMSLELANAMIYSNYTHTEVELPLDRQKYADLLADLKAGKK